jgi:hypothetical protein
MMSPRLAVCLALCAVPLLRAELFPKPEPAQAFADMKVYDAAGHPWRVAQEDWTGAKQRVAGDPVWGAWLGNERKAVDGWMAKHQDRVEWVCGWWHDFVSPKDGSHLTWTQAIPGEDVKFLASPSDPQVAITPKIMGGWVFEFRGHHADMIERAARLYRLTGDERYAAWVAAQLDFYAAHYLEWAPQREGARLYWQTLDVATNLFHYAEAVRLLGDRVEPARRTGWLDNFFRPQVEVLNHNFQSVHNIATWQRCAAAEVALVFGDEPMWQEALDGNYGLRRQMAEGITSDYLWWEQSFGYNSYVVKAVLGLFTTAGLHGRAGELAQEMAVAENLMLSPIYLRFPDGDVPNPADVTSHVVAPDRKLLAETYRVFPTTLGLELAQERRDWETLLDPPARPVRPTGLPEVKSQNLESTRMAVLHAGDWQVFLHYGQLTRSHAQAEALNFSASFAGTDITHDPGTVGYGSPLHKNYYTRGLNHNVPLVNGEGQDPQPQPGKLMAYSETSVAAAQPIYRSDASASRQLVIDGDRLVDTAVVESKGLAPQKLGLALHLQGKVRLPAAFAADANFAQGRPPSFGYWRNVKTATYRDRAEFEVVYGQLVLRVSIAVPGEFRIWHGDTPDEPPHRREGFYVETTGTKAVFTTTFAPGR